MNSLTEPGKIVKVGSLEHKCVLIMQIEKAKRDADDLQQRVIALRGYIQQLEMQLAKP